MEISFSYSLDHSWKPSGIRLQYCSFLAHRYTHPILRLIYFLTTSVLPGPQILSRLGDSWSSEDKRCGMAAFRWFCEVGKFAKLQGEQRGELTPRGGKSVTPSWGTSGIHLLSGVGWTSLQHSPLLVSKGKIKLGFFFMFLFIMSARFSLSRVRAEVFLLGLRSK